MKTYSSILNKLFFVLALGVLFLIVCSLTFIQLNQKVYQTIDKFNSIDGSIVSLNYLESEVKDWSNDFSQMTQTKDSQTLAILNKKVKALDKHYSYILQTLEKYHIDNQAALEFDKVRLAYTTILNSLTLSSPSKVDIQRLKVTQLAIDGQESLSSLSHILQKELEKSYYEVQQEKDTPLIVGTTFSILLILIFFVFAVFIYKKIRFFVLSQLKATLKISKGNWDVILDESGHDEFARINQSFNLMTKEIKRSHQDLSNYSHTIGHDLQTPLRHISIFADKTMTDLNTQNWVSAQSHLKQIKESSEEMRNLLVGLLEYAKIGQQQQSFEAVDLNTLVESLINQYLATDSRIEVKKEPLPIVQGQPELLKKVFQNLFDNSIKYASLNGKVHLKLTTSIKAEKVVIKVSDQGPGIPNNQKERIFGLFKRNHSLEQAPGYGAGLAIVKRIIEAHGGRIWVEDNIPTGAIFCIELNTRN